MRNKLLIILALSAAVASSSYGEWKPPYSVAYVVHSYSCEQQGRTKHIAIFSQAFAVCYQETNHSSVGNNDKFASRQIANALCPGGVVTFSSGRTGYPYEGRNAETAANNERARDISESIRYGFTVESFHVQIPYSSKCQ